MPIIKTLKNGVWTPVNSVTSLGTATTTTSGLMSSSDKTTLDNLAEYSTTEKVIGTWVDGKPIYRKVIQTTLTTARSEIDHSIANLKSVTKAEGFIVYNAETYHIPSWEESTKNAQILNITQTKVVVTIGTGWSALYNSRPCTVILEYTKSTD